MKNIKNFVVTAGILGLSGLFLGGCSSSKLMTNSQEKTYSQETLETSNKSKTSTESDSTPQYHSRNYGKSSSDIFPLIDYNKTKITFNNQKKPGLENIENIALIYVTPARKLDEDILKLDSIVLYDTYAKGSVLDLFMGGRGLNFDPPVKVYTIKKINESGPIVIPSLIKGLYNFPKKYVKKDKELVKKLLGRKNISVSDPVEFLSGEMYDMFKDE